MGALAFATGKKLIDAFAEGRIYMSFTRRYPPVQGWFIWEFNTVDFVVFTTITALLFLLAATGVVVFTLKIFRPGFGEQSEKPRSKSEPT